MKEQNIVHQQIPPAFEIGQSYEMKSGLPFSTYGKNFDQVPENSVYSSPGYRKEGVSWIKNQIIILTTQKFVSHPITQITKIKVKRIGEVPDTQLLKVSIKKMDYFYCMSAKQTLQFFYLIIWLKLKTMNIANDHKESFINSCDGFLMKKSEILGKWEPRYVLITSKDGLMSHKNKQQMPSLVIDQTEEIWTRFELIQGKKYFVVKLWYGPLKQQFGVPVERAVKWCKAFYSLLKDI